MHAVCARIYSMVAFTAQVGSCTQYVHAYIVWWPSPYRYMLVVTFKVSAVPCAGVKTFSLTHYTHCSLDEIRTALLAVILLQNCSIALCAMYSARSVLVGGFSGQGVGGNGEVQPAEEGRIFEGRTADLAPSEGDASETFPR